MKSLFRPLSSGQSLVEQGPIVLASLLITELFYKFHSFTLELVAGLATWYVLSVAISLVLGGPAVRRRPRER